MSAGKGHSGSDDPCCGAIGAVAPTATASVTVSASRPSVCSWVVGPGPMGGESRSSSLCCSGGLPRSLSPPRVCTGRGPRRGQPSCEAPTTAAAVEVDDVRSVSVAIAAWYVVGHGWCAGARTLAWLGPGEPEGDDPLAAAADVPAERTAALGAPGESAAEAPARGGCANPGTPDRCGPGGRDRGEPLAVVTRCGSTEAAGVSVAPAGLRAATLSCRSCRRDFTRVKLPWSSPSTPLLCSSSEWIVKRAVASVPPTRAAGTDTT